MHHSYCRACANENIAKYFHQLPGKHLFDRITLKNKLILRKILKGRLGLDSDELGKLCFSYDSRSVVLQNWDDITHEFYACDLWNQVPVGLSGLFVELAIVLGSNPRINYELIVGLWA